MAKYTFYVTSTETLMATVEAASFEEAAEIYEEMDGGEFVGDPCSASWDLVAIENDDTGEWREI